MGSIVRSSLTSDTDAEKRIRSVAAAFARPEEIALKLPLDGTIRGGLYSVLVLTALLYGSEARCLHEA